MYNVVLCLSMATEYLVFSSVVWRVPRVGKRSGITACHMVAAPVITDKRVPWEIGGNKSRTNVDTIRMLFIGLYYTL